MYTAKVKARAKSSNGPGAQGVSFNTQLRVKGQSESAVVAELQKAHPKCVNFVIESLEWR
jgi:hypothetical protein